MQTHDSYPSRGLENLGKLISPIDFFKEFIIRHPQFQGLINSVRNIVG